MNTYFKKIIVGLLIVCLFAGSSGVPQKAYAQLSTIEVNSTPSLFQTIANAASNLGTSFNTYYLVFKACCLDTIATTLAKQLIRQITASVVNWINTGFEGSPSFIQNPGSFFLDVADQVTGEFLAQAGGPLTDLCSPFSIDIRLALAFKYRPNIPKRYECTLGKIITNSKNAIEGASINGFTAGDFRQGGWPAFVSLTTEPQNNVFGAYLQADSELSLRVANAQVSKKDEISNGKGFLSWRDPKCKQAIKQAKEDYYKERSDQGTGEGDYTGPERDYEGTGEAPSALKASENDCPIQTPGSLIVSNLETSINGPLHELELVDSINEIVNALAAQLVTQVLQKGLGAVSGSGPSDSSSYINRIQAEANTSIDQVGTIRTELLKNVATYLDFTLQYKTNKDQSLTLALDAKTSYESVQSCYAVKIANQQPPLTSPQIAMANAKILEVNSIITTKIAPVAEKALAATKEADARYKALTDIRDQANAAKTVNDLNAPSQKYSQMLQSQSLTTQKDITASQQELDETKALVAPMKQDAQRKVQECAIFPYGSGAGTL